MTQSTIAMPSAPGLVSRLSALPASAAASFGLIALLVAMLFSRPSSPPTIRSSRICLPAWVRLGRTATGWAPITSAAISIPGCCLAFAPPC